MKYFNKLFGIYADPINIQIYILGKLFSFKKKFLYYEKMSQRKLLIELNKKIDKLSTTHLIKIDQLIKDNIATALLHRETFSKYKNICNNKEVMVFATGPSAADFCPIKDSVNIGVNRAILMDNIKLDYYFTVDYKAVCEYMDKIINYNPQCEKFIGYIKEAGYETSTITIPEESIIKANAKRYKIDWFMAENDPGNGYFVLDIDKKALASFKSIIFAAVQFAMFTNPKKLYLVGCDCNNTGYYDGVNRVYDLKVGDVVQGWRKFKIFAQTFYPNCEIISINPVGLRGLFKDVYTQSYLEKHPEIDKSKVEIIKSNVEIK